MVWEDLVYENETYTSILPALRQEDEVKFDRGLFSHYRKLVQIRHDQPALRRGDFKAVLIDDARGLYAYARQWQANRVVVVLNNSQAPQQVELPAFWGERAEAADLLSGTSYPVVRGRIRLELQPKWGVVLTGTSDNGNRTEGK